MKVLVILLVLIGFITITPQAFGSCEFLPCDDTNIEADKPNYRFVDFSYANIVGESIRFTLEKIAYNNCDSHNAEITDEKGNLVWGESRESLCVPNNSQNLVTSHIKIGYNENHPIIINESGNYFIKIELDNGSIEKEFVVRKNHTRVTLDPTPYPMLWNITSPLKQLELGISFDEIQCKQNLVLLQKYDGTPACVTEPTKTKLIERGWTINNKLNNSDFDNTKSNIENLGYDICSIRIADNTIVVDLNKIFEGTKQEKQIISQVPPYTDYDIVYHDGYTDYFINTMTSHKCE